MRILFLVCDLLPITECLQLISDTLNMSADLFLNLISAVYFLMLCAQFNVQFSHLYITAKHTTHKLELSYSAMKGTE
jgi:hypothetical protein